MFGYSIKLNGDLILRGDKPSMEAVFNNISGRDYRPDRLIEPHPHNNHDQYIDQLGNLLGQPVFGVVMLFEGEDLIDTAGVTQQAA